MNPSTPSSSQDFSPLDTIGGVRGLVESVLPALAFILLYLFTRSLPWTVGISLFIACAEFLLRLIQKQKLAGTFFGFVSVLVCLLTAWFSHDARNFYLPGFILNAVLLAFLLISMVAKTPGVGFLVEVWRDADISDYSTWSVRWKQDKALLSAYRLTTWIWVGVFAVRLLVEVPLYLTQSVAWLGTARVILGIPLFLLGLWVSWILLAGPIQANKAARPSKTDSASSDSAPMNSESDNS
ncbi:hypothetical protein A200_03734 [Parascardovia denticolens IPLA 20019]|uniref:DUF3159 domain-containing protein n=1 Tax=Parascardovia denticolens TaxID=78258 RepID=UPI000266C0FE|nr:DUF3159 domain-containing protein [Parascardovia denticolens]EIT88313.1 hypothetical protein A200_03734 [Parascardovia denticolens IPLA 20019]